MNNSRAVFNSIAILISSSLVALTIFVAPTENLVSVNGRESVRSEVKGELAYVEPTIQNGQAVVSIGESPVKGDFKNAQVAIVEFSDYQCPFCKRFVDETLPQLEAEYLDSGEAVFVFKDLPLPNHDKAVIQAEAAHCVGNQGDDLYYEMHDNIFAAGGDLDETQLKLAAQDVNGVDMEKYNNCIESNATAGIVNRGKSEATALGITGTPGFVVGTLDENGVVTGEIISGAQDYSVFKEAIDKYIN